jgi:hypothetical protein
MRFQELARRLDRPVAGLIREAMTAYLAGRDPIHPAIRRLRTFANEPLGPLPDRAQIWDEIASR